MENSRSRTRSRKIRKIQLFCLLLLYLFFQLTIFYFDRHGLTVFNGVLVSLQFGCCLLMIKVDAKRGRRLAIICLGLAAMNLIAIMFFKKNNAPLPGFFNTIFYIVAITVIGLQREKQQKLIVTDYLTGLKNRRGIIEKLNQKNQDNETFNIIYIELSNFKYLNNNYGFDYGENLLKIVTERIKKVIGKKGVCGLLGTSGFLIILDADCYVKEVAELVIAEISNRIEINKNENIVGSYLQPYAGISCCPKNGHNVENLIKCAEIASYNAERTKTERVVFYEKSMEKDIEHHIEMEKLINDALENNYFEIVYQPQYTTSEKKLRGFESLLRINLPDGRVIYPSDFIPIAENSDLILQVDEYVLKRAMSDFKDTVMTNDCIISVNVSSKNIASPDFIEKIKSMLNATGFPAINLEIEITEYCLVQSMEDTVENIKNLRNLGIHVALDDFGTGYTSLSYVAKMPVNLLKIDKSLIDGIENDSKSLKFVNAVISIGHIMGCEVISEGVETQHQLDLLAEQKCDLIQGFIWGEPIGFKDAEKLINDSSWLIAVND